MDWKKITLPVLVFICAISLLLSNAAFNSLGFADAAEFALLSDLAGIAHAPGFPAYILLSKFISMLLEGFGLSHISALVAFSAICTSLAAVLLYHTSALLLQYGWTGLDTTRIRFISFTTALLPLTGTTIWHWSHSVEVYALQILAAMMVLYGMTLRETGKHASGLLLAGAGIGIGLSNHHLTMILLLPFAALLWKPGWLSPVILSGKRKSTGAPFTYINKDLRLLLLPAVLLPLLGYGWMFFRSSAGLPFVFGNPDNLERMFYHLSGGAWIKNTQTVVKGIIAMRTPYFLRISFEQFFFSGIFMVLAIIYLYTGKRNRLWLALFGYYFFLLIYQLRIDQTTDTDAYLCTPFFLLFALVPFGMARVCSWYARAFYFLPLLLAIQAVIHYPKTDQRDMDLSNALMRDLDTAAPKGAIMLIADWTNVINYNYARIHDGFRKDLCVLNYDLKFTHYDLFRRNYPEVYKAVSVSYDRYIQLLGQYHPEEIYNTGCTLDQPELVAAFIQVVKDLQTYAKNHHVPFMADPKAYVFLAQQGLFSNTHVSGSYVSDQPGQGNDAFLRFDHRWIHNTHVLSDPAAADKLVDLEAAFDFQRTYWQQTGDQQRMQLAEKNYRSIKQMQNRMKKKMAFLFRRP
ncbi:MAG: DUF2723 domain-containing protein [Bacteroidia bacterium]